MKYRARGTALITVLTTGVHRRGALNRGLNSEHWESGEPSCLLIPLDIWKSSVGPFI